MARLTAKDFDQGLLDLYDYYVHGHISKRQFLDRAGKFAVGGLTAPVLLKMLSPDYALAQEVPEGDPAIVAGMESYSAPNGSGTVMAYRVKPSTVSGRLPAVVVVHENRGLNPYIKDVARRLGKAGFMAFAPDGLSPLGGYPGSDDKGREMQASLDPVKLMNDFFAAVEVMMEDPASTGKVGIVGFCYGGGVFNAAAVAYPELSAAVSFYGRQPKLEDVPRIQAPIQLHYAALDSRITDGWPGYEAALKASGKTYAGYVYAGVNHGFHNDTTPRYDPAAAKLAWARTQDWFSTYLM
ncbi:dienelactone hydrolase family protein, partial [Thioclava sp. BHET1]